MFNDVFADRIFLTVDGVPLRFYLRDTTEYESRTYYQCAEGQIVDLICSKFQNYGRLKLKYYDQNGKIINICQRYNDLRIKILYILRNMCLNYLTGLS